MTNVKDKDNAQVEEMSAIAKIKNVQMGNSAQLMKMLIKIIMIEMLNVLKDNVDYTSIKITIVMLSLITLVMETTFYANVTKINVQKENSVTQMLNMMTVQLNAYKMTIVKDSKFVQIMSVFVKLITVTQDSNVLLKMLMEFVHVMKLFVMIILPLMEI